MNDDDSSRVSFRKTSAKPAQPHVSMIRMVRGRENTFEHSNFNSNERFRLNQHYSHDQFPSSKMVELSQAQIVIGRIVVVCDSVTSSG